MWILDDGQIQHFSLDLRKNGFQVLNSSKKNTESIMKASANCKRPESIWDINTNSMLHVGKPKPVEASDFVDINAPIPFCYWCNFLLHVLEKGDTVKYKYNLPSEDQVSYVSLENILSKIHHKWIQFSNTANPIHSLCFDRKTRSKEQSKVLYVERMDW